LYDGTRLQFEIEDDDHSMDGIGLPMVTLYSWTHLNHPRVTSNVLNIIISGWCIDLIHDNSARSPFPVDHKICTPKIAEGIKLVLVKET
jgi:hypothetical protein